MSGFFFAAAGAAVTVEQPIDGQTGVWIKSGGVTINSGMTMVGADVSSGQSQYIYSRGLASASLISGGVCLAVNGGVASGCRVVLAGGSCRAQSGGVLSDCSVSGGGMLYLIRGGTGFNLSATGVVNIACYQGGVISGGSIMNKGGLILSRGSAFNVSGVGRCHIDWIDSSVMSGCFINSAPVFCSAGVISGVSMAEGINEYGQYSIFLRSGTTAVDCSLYGNQAASFISAMAGAFVENCTARILAYITCLSGASASNVVISSGGTLTVSSGGTALAVTSNAGATVTVLDGGYIEYA